MKNLFFGFFLGTLLSGCHVRKQDTSAEELFEPGISVGEIEGNELKEASGLAESINNPGMLWAHNDSGNDADIFLIDKSGKKISKVHLNNINNRDWEDIAVGPGPEAGKNYLYVGEIGDNKAVFPYKYIYRIEEPIVSSRSDTSISTIDILKFKLADGSRDTEALMIDPLSGDLYVFSKREAKISLYKMSFPQSTDEVIVAETVLSKLPFTQIVAADISKDGDEVLIKDYDNVYYWRRENNETLTVLLKKPPIVLPYNAEPQGESIAFDRDGKGYYTLSEKKEKMPQHLFFYKRK